MGDEFPDRVGVRGLVKTGNREDQLVVRAPPGDGRRPQDLLRRVRHAGHPRKQQRGEPRGQRPRRSRR
ncbi:MAG TPA: hypothetical protein VL422_05650, partial [Miltoncostaea sp.]|nr:hypothetical protein [Miltoncostaea sp.]